MVRMGTLRGLCAVLLGFMMSLSGAASGEEPQRVEKRSDDDEARRPRISGQIHVRHESSNATGAPDGGELSIARAKAEIKWRPRKRLDGVLGFDLSPLSRNRGVELGDAYLEVVAAKWLRYRAGHRKIPFSRMRLQSRARLATVTRGEYGRQLNLVFNDEGPSDLWRQVGVDARFRLGKPRRRLDIGWSEGEDGPRDLAARFTIRPVRGLDLGAAFALIRVKPVTGTQQRSVGEIDLAAKVGSWRAEAEAALGDAADDEGDDEFAAGFVLLAYRWAFGDKSGPAIEPLVRFELIDQKLRVRDDHAWAVTAGLNHIPNPFLRVMLDVEHVERFSGYGGGFNTEDETRLLVQLALDV